MEKKVSEVFEINDKWYQCIKSSDCQRCSFYNIVSKCSDKFPCVPTKRHEMEEIKKIKIPEGYVFDHENGSEIILTRKKNTIFDLNDYTKCYSFMYDNGDIANVGMNTYIPRGTICAIDSLCQLLVCRNAWWEVLNWKPDWSNQEQKKYCIGYIKGKVDTTTNEGSNRILAFPSEEVRSDFFNTFYDLIEVSKELL